MSKEQTPMEELLSIVEELKSKGQEVDTNGLEDWINSVGLSKEKEHTNAKVLEALESDLKDLSDCYRAHAEDNPRKEVCQVLHTLITEKQEQIAQTKQK